MKTIVTVERKTTFQLGFLEISQFLCEVVSLFISKYGISKKELQGQISTSFCVSCRCENTDRSLLRYFSIFIFRNVINDSSTSVLKKIINILIKQSQTLKGNSQDYNYSRIFKEFIQKKKGKKENYAKILSTMFERICSFAFNLRYYSYGFKFFVTNGA